MAAFLLMVKLMLTGGVFFETPCLQRIFTITKHDKNMKAYSEARPKLFSNKVLHYFTKLNPFRGELVEVEMKVVGKRIVYTYTKIRDTH